jgi:hypothetical protein
MEITNLRFFADLPIGKLSPEQSLARAKIMAERLADIHPIFARMSVTFQGSRKKMEKEPLLADDDVASWQKYLKKGEIEQYRIGDDNGSRVRFWNRLWDDDVQIFEITMDSMATLERQTRLQNGIMMRCAAVCAFDDKTLLDMMQVFIETHDAYRAYTTSLFSDQVPKFKFYQYWVREGTAFPPSPPFSHYDLVHHPAPPQSQPWLNGTLYTWPEHEPHKLMREFGE